MTDRSRHSIRSFHRYSPALAVLAAVAWVPWLDAQVTSGVMHPEPSGSCYGHPSLSANERGDFGMTLANGGRAGGGGTAVQGYAGMSDEYSNGGVPGKLGAVFLVASGTHNPTGNPPRWGDYVTARQHAPCELFFVATSYALSGGTAAANVNARYIEFGRGRDSKCYDGWRDAVRAP